MNDRIVQCYPAAVLLTAVRNIVPISLVRLLYYRLDLKTTAKAQRKRRGTQRSRGERKSDATMATMAVSIGSNWLGRMQDGRQASGRCNNIIEQYYVGINIL